MSPLDIRPHVIDLWRMADERLHAGALGGLPLFALKYGRHRGLIRRMRDWSGALKDAWRRRKAMTRIISREAGEFAMTPFQQELHEAHSEGQRELVLELLQAKFTDIDPEEIEGRLDKLSPEGLQRCALKVLSAESFEAVFDL